MLFYNDNELPMGYRFQVTFLIGGLVPNPIDIAFKKVSGLSQSISTENYHQGGGNDESIKLPTKIEYDNLVLERGLVGVSPLSIEFTVSLSLFKFLTSNVIVTLLDEEGMPVNAWLLLKAYPVKWSVSDFDADSSAIVIDRMELAYNRFFRL
jgi:phage tail-like protein